MNDETNELRLFLQSVCLIIYVYIFNSEGQGLKRFLSGFSSKKFTCINRFRFVRLDIWNKNCILINCH